MRDSNGPIPNSETLGSTRTHCFMQFITYGTFQLDIYIWLSSDGSNWSWQNQTDAPSRRLVIGFTTLISLCIVLILPSSSHGLLVVLVVLHIAYDLISKNKNNWNHKFYWSSRQEKTRKKHKRIWLGCIIRYLGNVDMIFLSRIFHFIFEKCK